MKTNYFTNRKLSIYSLLGFMALLTASCGSYQSSSYYDSDGIYGNQKREQAASPETAKSNQYKDYFSSLQNQPTQSFTNVDDYSTYNDSTTTAAPQNYSTGNPGWGEDSGPVTVNVYGNNWGYNYWNAYWYQPYWGFGWNSWYGPGWGWGSWYNSYWGYPYYGYGWNNYYYGGNHYNSGYAYHGGRRGGYYGNGMANNSGRQYSMGRRSYTQMGAPRAFTGTRSFNTRGGYSTRSYPTQSNNSYSTPRGNSGTRGYSSPSYNGGGSRGGGGYSGGGYGGGSRGGGGGGGRR